MKRRIEAVPEAVVDTLYGPADPVELRAPVVVTGLGSSQCASRLLAGLLTSQQGLAALYVPTTEFFRGTHARGETLVVFSQGLSANARIALARRRDYNHCVLVTSSTEEGLRAAGKDEPLDLLRTLLDEGVAVVRHPLEDEYTLLPRFIGPACALACAIRMAGGYAAPPRDVLRKAWVAAVADAEAALDWTGDLAAVPEWNFSGAAVEYCGNLQAKVMECLFVRLPQARDMLEFSHGGFQANCHRPAPQWIFGEASPADDDLLAKLRPLFTDKPHPLRVVRSPLAFPFNLLYYECFLNRLLLEAVARQGVDLIEWPGKGRDGAGYGLSAPYAGD